jgi:hypothetical protein
LLELFLAPFNFHENALSGIADEARKMHVVGKSVDKGPEADSLHCAANSQAQSQPGVAGPLSH